MNNGFVLVEIDVASQGAIDRGSLMPKLDGLLYQAIMKAVYQKLQVGKSEALIRRSKYQVTCRPTDQCISQRSPRAGM
jgi:hypothetical protein